ncbi:MAG TPA: DUF262 domain-containing protein [Thermoanaerobaculia bacterium]
MPSNNITLERMKLSKLLRAVDERRFAIPKLQREFVWDGPKAARLLDSIVRGMPVGTIMVWQAPRTERLHLRQNYHILPPFDPKHLTVWFLMDGQQRLSVLHHVREGDVRPNARRRDIDFKRVVLSLEGENAGQVVHYRKPVEETFVSLSDVLSSRWRTLLRSLPKRKFARVAEVRQAVLDYSMFLMFQRASIEDVREAFLRINTQGMKISNADAIFARAEDLHLRDVLHEVRDGLDEAFRDIGEQPVLFAMLSVRGDSEARGDALERALTRLEQQVTANPSLRKSLERTWRQLRECFGKAVDYLRQNYKILNLEYLYSDYMIAILALFFYRNGGRNADAYQREQINRWFWSTTVSSRYSGRNFNRYIRKDVEYFTKLAEGGRVPFRFAPEADRRDVTRAQYQSRTGITSACYSLLLLRRPVSIMDDGLNEIPLERYATRANRKDRHHIFPAGLMSRFEQPPKDYNSIANIALLTAQENQRIGRKQPRSYLDSVRDNEKTFRAKMNRHLIPCGSDSAVWDEDLAGGFRRFLRQRTGLICKELEELAGMPLFRGDEPPGR